MIKFKSFLKEEKKHIIPWEKPNHGWLGNLQHLPDDHEVTLYHGTTHDKAHSIMKSGITIPDKRTGYVSLTPDPNTAHGYASMGGEANFRRNGPQARHIPHEERSVIKMKVKAGWLKQHMDPHMRGNIGVASDALKNKSKYDEFKSKYPNAPDHLHYAMTEYRVPPIHKDNEHVQFVGIMKKPKKK